MIALPKNAESMITEYLEDAKKGLAGRKITEGRVFVKDGALHADFGFYETRLSYSEEGEKAIQPATIGQTAFYGSNEIKGDVLYWWMPSIADGWMLIWA